MLLLGQLLVSSGQFLGFKAQILDRHLVIFAQPATDFPHHGQRKDVAALQQVVKIVFVQFQHANIGQSRHACPTRRIVDQCHFTKKVARLKSLQRAHFAGIDPLCDLHAALQQYVKNAFERVFVA